MSVFAWDEYLIWDVVDNNCFNIKILNFDDPGGRNGNLTEPCRIDDDHFVVPDGWKLRVFNTKKALMELRMYRKSLKTLEKDERKKSWYKWKVSTLWMGTNSEWTSFIRPVDQGTVFSFFFSRLFFFFFFFLTRISCVVPGHFVASSSSNITVWDWKRGVCLRTIEFKRSYSLYLTFKHGLVFTAKPGRDVGVSFDVYELTRDPPKASLSTEKSSSTTSSEAGSNDDTDTTTSSDSDDEVAHAGSDKPQVKNAQSWNWRCSIM
jgi:hypothetical protein